MAELKFRVQADYEKVQRLRDEIAKLKQEIKGVDAIQDPTAFNALNVKLQQTSKELSNVTGRIAQASAAVESDFKQKIFAASQNVNSFTEKIIAQKSVVKDVAADVRRLSEAYHEAAKVSPMSAGSKLAEWRAAKNALEEEKAALFGLTQEQANARLSVKRLRDEYALLREDGGGTAQTMNMLSEKMKQIGTMVIGGLGLKELGSKIISVRAEFESMETSLKVLLGGSQQRLDSLMGQIKEYALASPLNTKDMVGAVQMMTSFGIEAEKSIDYLKAIGDISMGDAGKFNSLALAFSQMSSAGKLMGQDLMQMVNAGFNPLEEIARKTGKSIGQLKEEMSKGAISSKMVQDAFISATSAGGKFFGMSVEGAKTLNGQISMLEESFDNMFNEIGGKGEGVVMTAVQMATKLVENYEQVGRILLGLVETYGAYRVGLAVATVAQNGHTLAMTLARAQILITQKAQALLNATMLSNPYVLAATTLGALVGVIIATSDGLTTAERAQKAFNDTVKQTEEAQAKYNRETEQAINLASSDATATDDRRKAMNLLISRYPTIIKKYIDEEGHLKNILGFKREIAAMDGKEKIIEYKGKASDARQAANAFKLVKLAERKAVSAGMSESEYIHFLTKDQQQDVKWANMWYEKNANPSWFRRGTTQERLEFATNFAKSANYKAGRTATGNAISNFQDAIGKMSKQRLLTLRNTLIKAQKTKKNVTFPYKELQGVALNQDDISKLFIFTDGVYTSKTKKTTTTKKDLDDQKKALQAQLEGLSEVEAKGKKGAEIRKKLRDIQAKEDAYSASYDTKNKKSADAKKEKDHKEKIREAKEHQQMKDALDAKKLARKQAELDIENEAEQERINALEDGVEKTIATMKLAHKKELMQIDKQKQEYLRSKQEEAKAAFDANKKNKDKVFDYSSVTLSAAEQGKFDEMRANILKKHANEEKDYQKQQIQALNDYLKEYGSMQEKRLAIAKEYDEKITKAQSEGERLSLNAQKAKALSDFDLTEEKKNLNWEDIFGDLTNQTIGQLEKVKAKLRDMLNSDNLSVEGYKTAVEQIEKVNNAIIDVQDKQRSFFDFSTSHAKERRKLEMDVADALQRQTDAITKQKTAQGNLLSKQIGMTQLLSNYDVKYQGDITASKTGEIFKEVEKKYGTDSEAYKKVRDAMEDLAASERELIEANEKKKSADSSVVKSQGKLDNFLGDLQGKLKGLGESFDMAMSNLNSLPDLLSELGVSAESSVMKGVKDLAEAGNAAQSAMKDFMSGNFIGAASNGIHAFKSLGNSIGHFFSGDNDKEVRRTTERLTASNKELAKRIDSLSDTIGSSAGAKAVNAYDTALKAQNEINKNNMNILKAQMRNYGKHHSNSYYANDRIISSYNKDAQLAFKAAGVDSANITGLDSIYSLSPEQLNAIRNFAPNLWKYLTEVGKNDKKEYWDAVVEQAGKTEKLTEQIKNNLTQTSFDSLRSGFLDTLMNMDADAEDWSNNFSKMLFKSIVNKSILNDGFDKWLKDFQNKWADKVNSGSMSQGDYAAYRDEYNNKMMELKNQTNNIASAVGYSDASSSQKATANGVSSITFEQANNIVALTTAGNISRDQIKDILTAKLSTMDASMRGIQMMAVEQKSIADELRTIQANSYIELQGIHEDTTAMNKTLKVLSSDVSDIKKNLKDM